MTKPDGVARKIDAKFLDRAMRVDTTMIGPYMDETITAMHQYLDEWRYGRSDAENLQLATDAFIAMLTAAEARGLA